LNRDVTFDEIQITMMCKDLEKRKKKVHVEVKTSTDGPDHMKAPNDIN